jgi:hypothetical protein
MVLGGTYEYVGDHVLALVDGLDEKHALVLPRLAEYAGGHLRRVIAVVHVITKFFALGDRPRRQQEA